MPEGGDQLYFCPNTKQTCPVYYRNLKHIRIKRMAIDKMIMATVKMVRK